MGEAPCPAWYLQADGVKMQVSRSGVAASKAPEFSDRIAGILSAMGMVKHGAKTGTSITRRGFLRGGVSAAALFSLPETAGSSTLPIPPELFQPGAQAMADTVKAIVELLKPSIVGVDLADLEAVLRNGGQGAFGQAIIVRRSK